MGQKAKRSHLRSRIFLRWLKLNATKPLTIADSLRAADLCLDADTPQDIREKSEQPAAEGAISFFSAVLQASVV